MLQANGTHHTTWHTTGCVHVHMYLFCLVLAITETIDQLSTRTHEHEHERGLGAARPTVPAAPDMFIFIAACPYLRAASIIFHETSSPLLCYRWLHYRFQGMYRQKGTGILIR